MISFPLSSLLHKPTAALGNHTLGIDSSFIKSSQHGHGERLVSSQETVERVQGLFPVFGITRVANVTGLDHIGIPVVMVTRPNSRSISVSQGKGTSLHAAKASGIMEAIEGYHAENITLPLRLASYAEMFYAHKLPDLNLLPRISGRPLQPHDQILWIEGTDILNACSTMVPYEMVNLNFRFPLPTGCGYFPANSNGLASGNHLLEAINHAISEVIERDATTLWDCLHEQAQEKTKVDLTTVDDEACSHLLKKYQEADVLAGVWESTTDIGIPSFICRIIQNAPPPHHHFRPATGMGCHPNRSIALKRALTEAAQSRLTFIAGARDDMPRAEYIKHLQEDMYHSWRRKIDKTSHQRHFRDGASFQSHSLAEDIDWQLTRLKASGITQVIVVNLTREEFEIPVVKVIIPGLEGIASSRSYIFGARAQNILKQNHL
ncbi:MAG: YcaO-like family protein [Rhodospirillaceae bacterium]|nr:YcaO-like family protein [Rhodospirillaceae bacterium]